jgi:hypothetical protein
VQELEVRVLRNHKENCLEIYGGGKLHSHLSPLTQTTKMSKALIVFGELFYFVWKVIEGVFYCSVIYVGQEYNSRQYGLP